MVRRRKTVPLVGCVLLLVLGGAVPALAQAVAGSLAGRLTDLYSHPVDGAALTLRNRATGEVVHATAGRNGSYRFPSLGPGEYTLEAESRGLGRGQLQGIVIVAGHEARVQAAMAFAPEPPAPVPMPQRVTMAENRAPELPPALSVLARPPEPPSAPLRYTAPPPAVPPPLTSARADAWFPTQSLTLVPLAPPAVAPAPLALPRVAPPEVAGDRGSPPELAVVVAPPARLALLPVAAPVPVVLRAAAPQLLQAAAFSAHAAMLDASRETLAEAARQSSDDITAVTITLTAAELAALPISGHAWENVALDARTAAPDDSDVDAGSPRELPARISVDGMDTRLAFGAHTSGRAQGRAASLIGPGSSEAALREVQATTGSATSGSGSRARVETARGGDGLHGQASVTTRQNLFGAQNPFTEWTRETAPASATTTPVFVGQPLTPEDNDILWNLAAGGRIRRTRFHWYASLDSQRHSDPGVSTVRHPDNFFAQPTNDAMQMLAARLDLSNVNPVGEGIAAYSDSLETLAGLLGPAPRTMTRWTGFGRLDAALGPRSRILFESTATLRDAPGGGLGRAAEPYGIHSYGNTHTAEQWFMARWENLIAPHLIAVTQAAYGRHVLTLAPETPSAFEQSLNIGVLGQLPQIGVDSRYGFTIGNPARFGSGTYPDENIEQAQEQLAWTHRSLELRAGLQLSHNTDTTTFLRNRTGTYSYARVENFISDALSFAAFGLNGQLNVLEQHNCDATGKVWRDTIGQLHGLGPLPCYSTYTQTLGPTDWWLSTNDWGGSLAASWRPARQLTLTLGTRWDLEQSPPPLAQLANADLPLAGQMPSFGSQWGPRAGLAWMPGGRNAPVLRVGYGLYFSRTPNATLETALTQTGSANGDVKYFLRATDNLSTGGAPPFPYVLAGPPGSGAKPEAVEFAPGFRNGEIHQVVASVEQTLPGRIHLEAALAAALARRLPLLLDANIDTAANPGFITYNVVDGNGTGPLKQPQITVPFYASWPTPTAGRLNPNYQQIGETFSRANSTYESASLVLARSGRGGLNFQARYTYAHTMDWNPDDSVTFTRPSVFDPADSSAEYGTSDLDVRHSATLAVVWQPRWHPQDWLGHLAGGWRLSSAGSFRSGLPYTMRTSGTLPREYTTSGALIVGLGSGMNGYGGENRVYGIGRNTYRYPATWKADLRLARRFSLGEMRELELLAQSFNLFNHQNVTQLETVGYTIDSGTPSGTLPSLNYLTGLKTGQTEFGQPLDVNATDYFRPRQIEFGLRLRF